MAQEDFPPKKQVEISETEENQNTGTTAKEAAAVKEPMSKKEVDASSDLLTTSGSVLNLTAASDDSRALPKEASAEGNGAVLEVINVMKRNFCRDLADFLCESFKEGGREQLVNFRWNGGMFALRASTKVSIRSSFIFLWPSEQDFAKRFQRKLKDKLFCRWATGPL